MKKKRLYFWQASFSRNFCFWTLKFHGFFFSIQIPNPLFDLAGITCGHFLVPFWTFFGATLIGKAVVKMHIQTFFVIFAFNESLINMAVGYVSRLPVLGPKVEGPFKELLRKQKEKLHQKGAGTGGGEGGSVSLIDDPDFPGKYLRVVIF